MGLRNGDEALYRFELQIVRPVGGYIHHVRRRNGDEQPDMPYYVDRLDIASKPSLRKSFLHSLRIEVSELLLPP